MRTRRVSTVVGSLAAVLVVGLLATVLIAMSRGGTSPGSGGETSAQHFARVGGLQIVLQVQKCPSLGPNTEVDCAVQALMARFLATEQQRAADLLGVKDAVVANTQDNRVEIDLPGYTDVDVASVAFTTSGTFDVIETGGTILGPGTDVSARICLESVACPPDGYPIAFTGDQVDRSTVTSGNDAQSGAPVVTFAFAGAARDQFATYTAHHINDALTLTLNGIVIESATIQSEITGSVQIIGLGSIAEAQRVATTLRLGALPLPATLLSVTIVGPGTSCVTPTPGTPPVYPGTATPAPNATATPQPAATPGWTAVAGTVTPSGQAANLPPVYSGGPGRSATPDVCATPTVTPKPGDTPAPTIPPTPSRVVGTPTDTPPATFTPPPPPPTPTPTP